MKDHISRFVGGIAFGKSNVSVGFKASDVSEKGGLEPDTVTIFALGIGEVAEQGIRTLQAANRKNVRCALLESSENEHYDTNLSIISTWKEYETKLGNPDTKHSLFWLCTDDDTVHLNSAISLTESAKAQVVSTIISIAHLADKIPSETIKRMMEISTPVLFSRQQLAADAEVNGSTPSQAESALLVKVVIAISRMTTPSHTVLNPEDFFNVLQRKGMAYIGFGQADSSESISGAISKALDAFPQDRNISEVSSVMMAINMETGNNDLFAVNEGIQYMQSKLAESTDILFAIDHNQDISGKTEAFLFVTGIK